jgi:hypothetical protein
MAWLGKVTDYGGQSGDLGTLPERVEMSDNTAMAEIPTKQGRRSLSGVKAAGDGP